MRALLLVLAIGLAIGMSAEARGASDSGRIDLPLGIAHPSNSGAVFLNPAPLGTYSDSVIDAKTFPEYLLSYGLFPPVEVSYSLGLKAVGFGVGLRNFSGVTTGAIGIGAGVDAFQIGVNVSTQIPDQLFAGLAVGARFGDPKKVTGAIVLPNPHNDFLGAFTLGLGIRAGMVAIEPDLTFDREPSAFSFSSVTGSIALGLIPHERFSLKLSMNHAIIPAFSLDYANPELALMLWFTKAFGIQAGINHPLGGWMLGMKILY